MIRSSQINPMQQLYVHACRIVNPNPNPNPPSLLYTLASTCVHFPLMWSVECNQECCYLCCNCYYSIQQIRASDIWRESEHEDLQHRLLDYHVKVTMRGTRFDPPTIKFEGSTDDSMMNIQPQIDYNGMKIHDTLICYCGRYNVNHVKLPLYVYWGDHHWVTTIKCAI